MRQQLRSLKPGLNLDRDQLVVEFDLMLTLIGIVAFDVQQKASVPAIILCDAKAVGTLITFEDFLVGFWKLNVRCQLGSDHLATVELQGRK